MTSCDIIEMGISQLLVNWENLFIRYQYILSDFIKDQGVNKFTPWFLLMSQSMLPKWWDNIGDLKPFIDEENIIKY